MLLISDTDQAPIETELKNLLERGLILDELKFDNKRQLRETSSEIFFEEDETLNVAESHIFLPKFNFKEIQTKRKRTRLGQEK